MKIFILFQFFLLSICIRSYAVEECSSNPSALIWVPALKNSLIDEATRNLPQFCQWNRLDRLVRSFPPGVQRVYQKLKSQNDLQGVGDFLLDKAKGMHFDPWVLSMAGHPKIKSLASKFSFIVSCSEKIALSCPSASNEELENAIKKPLNNSSLQIPYYFSPENSTKSSTLQRAAACMLFSESSKSDCDKNLLKIEALMAIEKFQQDQVMIAPFSVGGQVFVGKNGLRVKMGEPRRSSMVTAAPVIKRILTDSAATEGLRRAAIKMLEQQKKRMNKTSNLFDDLKDSFIEAGLPKSEAEVNTWDTLGAIAATGPNFAKRWSRHSDRISGQKMNLKNIDDNPNAFLLQIIAEAIPKLDTQKALEHWGQIYSLPQGVSFDCDIGKTYHFWMTAYLSHQLTSQGSSADAAASASYIADLGYQLRREAFAGKELNVNDMERFGATENGIRMDLVLAASGAKFGVESAKNQEYSIDLGEKLRESMKATPVETTPMSVLGALPGFLGKSANFVDRIQPDFIFENMK
ncbi:MAG: hypothetical protein ACXVCY_14975 [Pseudobdellovibrionaceae bacterium]